MAIKQIFTEKELDIFQKVHHQYLMEDALYFLCVFGAQLDDPLDLDCADGTEYEEFIYETLSLFVDRFCYEQDIYKSEYYTWEDIILEWKDFHEEEYEYLIHILQKLAN